MADWYRTNLIDGGRSAALWGLIGFAVTYGVTRWITIRIRRRTALGDKSEGAAIKDVHIGGVHVHHQVWGILLVLVVGLLEFRFRPDSPWQEVLALLFGSGAALALDEFALWLHLEDVYWSEEGRKSIDAVMVATVIALAVLMGTSPVGVDNETVKSGLVFTSIVVLIQLGFTIICLLKGKLATGLIGLPIPMVAMIGAVRLAQPESFWARRHYSKEKTARAGQRFERHQARRDRLRDVLSGNRRPTPPTATTGAR